MDGRSILFRLKLQATLEARDDLYYHPTALQGISAKTADPCFYHPQALPQLFSKMSKAACLKRLSLFAHSANSSTTSTLAIEPPKLR